MLVIMYNNYDFFRLDSKHYMQKYGSIIIDFAYFKAANNHEETIEKNSVSAYIIFLINT